MAKRAPIGEEPYRPLLDANAIAAAVNRTPAEQPVVAPRLEKSVIPNFSQPATTEPPSEPTRIRAAVGPLEMSRRPISVQDLVEHFDHEKRILFTRSESMALDRLVRSLANRLNTQIKVSHVMRALVALLLNAEDEIDRRAQESVSLPRPANGDLKTLQLYVKEIAKIVGSAIRDAGPLETR